MKTNILQKSHPDSRFRIVKEDAYSDIQQLFGCVTTSRMWLNSWEDVTILQIMFTPKGDYLVEFILKGEEDE
ncbi:hypothetical protein [Pseudoalteromonas phage PH357]|nr:hypothetical protein [Pseudoalteromonas phage PH357]